MQALLVNRVENIVTKGEIAHHEQFLLLPQCFLKTLCCSDVTDILLKAAKKHPTNEQTN